MPENAISQVAAGVVTGGLTAFGVVRYWLARLEKKFSQVDRHETEIAVAKEAVREIKDDVVALKGGMSSISATVATVASDVAFLRGWAQGGSSRER